MSEHAFPHTLWKLDIVVHKLSSEILENICFPYAFLNSQHSKNHKR